MIRGQDLFDDRYVVIFRKIHYRWKNAADILKKKRQECIQNWLPRQASIIQQKISKLSYYNKKIYFCKETNIELSNFNGSSLNNLI